MSNRQIAVTFLQLASSGNAQEAFDKYVASDFRHHNQYFKGDRQALLSAMTDSSKTDPNKSIQVKHVFEDNKVIITHSLVTRQDPNALDIAVVHIFRFENNHIVEMWDLGQPISKYSPNENGIF